MSITHEIGRNKKGLVIRVLVDKPPLWRRVMKWIVYRGLPPDNFISTAARVEPHVASASTVNLSIHQLGVIVENAENPSIGA